MAGQLFRTMLLVFFVAIQEVLTLDTSPVLDPFSKEDILPKRQLRAAMKSHELGTRDVKGSLRFDHYLHYLDANTQSASQFAAQLILNFKTPTLLLEDIEHHIDKVDCYGSKIYLHFSSADALRHAHEEFNEVGSFLLITSHEGCNEDGERDSHMVSEFSVQVENCLIVLLVFRVPWKTTFNAMTLDFGESNGDFKLRRHGSLRPRQGAAALSSVQYPAAPTSTPQGTTVSENVNRQWLETAILPPDVSLSVNSPKIKTSWQISCKNCTIHGNIDLSSGSFTMGNPNNSSNTNESILNFLDNGYVEFGLNGFGAHIELENNITAQTQLTNLTVPLPQIPITPFQIAGIASLGPVISPNLYVEFDLEADLDFTYGFDVLVPDNSSILIDVGSLNKSSQQGFEKTNVTTIPFQTEVANAELKTTGGFNPQLLLSLSFFEGAAEAGVGVFLNLPSVTATLGTVSEVNSHCENVTNSTTANKALDDVFGLLTHVTEDVVLGIGLTEQLKGVFPDGYQAGYSPSQTLTATTFSLPTGCLSFDSHAKTYGPATVTTTSTATSTKDGKGTATGKSAASVNSPVGEGYAGSGRLLIVSGLLFVVSTCFMLF